MAARSAASSSADACGIQSVVNGITASSSTATVTLSTPRRADADASTGPDMTPANFSDADARPRRAPRGPHHDDPSIVFANPQNANVHQRKRNAHESMHMHMAWAKLGTHIAA